MARIQLLPDIVIDKIAAGEVVDRPASIVKELVENAIDAGATRIEIQLEEGGRKKISITDNGSGIEAEDLPLAVTRHATSKIRSADDLFNVSTMGFRGEALSAISAVSKFRIYTQTATAGNQLQMNADGGLTITPWQGRIGTTLVVEDLFYNIPARRAFLKSAAAELAVCSELIYGLSLANPSIEFTLHHNGKRHYTSGEPMDASWDEKIRDRMANIVGADVADTLQYGSRKSEYGSVEFLLTPPGKDFAHSKYVFIFLNGRIIKDKNVRFAIQRGYHSHLMKGRYPAIVLNLSIDPTLIDVNVHPAKTEVRFQYSSEVQSLVSIALREALRTGGWALSQDVQTKSDSHSAAVESLSTEFQEYVPKFLSGNRTPSQHLDFFGSSSWPRTQSKSNPSSNTASSVVPRTESSSPVSSVAPISSFSSSVASAARDVVPWSELEIIGVFANCYIIFAHRDRMLILDQHAFHERVVYERLTKRFTESCVSQPLMITESLNWAPEFVAQLKEHQSMFNKIGFAFDFLNDREVELLAVPSLLLRRDYASMLENAVEQIAASGQAAEEVIFHDLLATMACHSAVRGGDALNLDELQQMLREAEDVDFYLNCPHGRPVFKWWTQAQVAAWFER